MAAAELGQIIIAPKVLETITGIATAKVEGVHSLRSKTIKDKLTKTKKSITKGVYLQEEDGELTADIYVYLEYGVRVPAVSFDIQQSVKQAVMEHTDIPVATVNIHVEGMVPEKTPKPDLENLFGEDFANED